MNSDAFACSKLGMLFWKNFNGTTLNQYNVTDKVLEEGEKTYTTKNKSEISGTSTETSSSPLGTCSPQSTDNVHVEDN